MERCAVEEKDDWLSQAERRANDRTYDQEDGEDEGEQSRARIAPKVCPEYQTRIEQIPLKSTVAHLPIRRCLLVERLVDRLRARPDAQSVVQAIALNPSDPIPYCLCGPDLDTIEHSKCTTERCADSCTPAYDHFLSRFGLPKDPEPPCDPSS